MLVFGKNKKKTSKNCNNGIYSFWFATVQKLRTSVLTDIKCRKYIFNFVSKENSAVSRESQAVLIFQKRSSTTKS